MVLPRSLFEQSARRKLTLGSEVQVLKAIAVFGILKIVLMLFVLPEDCIHAVRYSLPKRGYWAWKSIFHSFLAAVVPEVKFPFEEIRESITPQKRRVYIRRDSSPGCQSARISDFDLEKEVIKAPIAVAFEEERVAVQVPRESNMLKWKARLIRLFSPE